VVDDQLEELEALVNQTIAEVELELEIILLQHFTAASKLADEELDALQLPTAALLAEYDEVLGEIADLSSSEEASAARSINMDKQQKHKEGDEPTGFFASALRSPSSVIELVMASVGAMALGCVFTLLGGAPRAGTRKDSAVLSIDADRAGWAAAVWSGRV